MSDTTVKFDPKFRDDIADYVESCKQTNSQITVEGFAKTIGVDSATLFAWANKKKKDDNGNLTDELARPKFNKALNDLQSLEVANTPKKEPADSPKSKEKKEIKEESKKEKKLNPKQELFCQLYATNRDFFANGVEAYAEAYGLNLANPKDYGVSKSGAYENLTKPHILKRIDELLELGPLNDTTVDRQLAFVIEQNADFGAKVAAMREYNKLKARITEKIDHTTKGEKLPIQMVTYKETANE